MLSGYLPLTLFCLFKSNNQTIYSWLLIALDLSAFYIEYLSSHLVFPSSLVCGISLTTDPVSIATLSKG